MRLRLSWAVAEGMHLDRGGSPLPYKWFEALADTDEEARELQFEVNANRMEREAIARLKRRG